MNAAPVNRSARLASRPIGLPTRANFTIADEPLGELPAGFVRVEIAYVSLDPAMRGWMNEGKSYVPPVKLGDVMRAYAVGHVIASDDPAFAVGASVAGVLGVQRFADVRGAQLTKIDTSRFPMPVYLSALGMTGLTAYFGLLDIGAPQPGQTVVVSGAAGAVGAVVGQIAKIKGCRVIGIAGGPAKCRYLTETLGFDVAIDYKATAIASALRDATPNGIDVYFDNVGGETLDAALARLALHARVVICGAISQYNATTAIEGPRNYLSLLVNRATMRGLVVIDYAARFPEATQALGAWLAAGKLQSREDIVTGIDTFPETLLRLFSGENNGKLILKVT